ASRAHPAGDRRDLPPVLGSRFVAAREALPRADSASHTPGGTPDLEVAGPRFPRTARFATHDAADPGATARVSSGGSPFSPFLTTFSQSPDCLSTRAARPFDP